MMELKAGINKLSTTRKKDGDHVVVGLAITLELQGADADERADISEAIDTGQQLYVSNILCQATGLRMRKTKEDSVTQVMLETKPTTAGIGHLYDLMAYGLLVTISEAQAKMDMANREPLPTIQAHIVGGYTRPSLEIDDGASLSQEVNGNMRSVNPETGEIETEEQDAMMPPDAETTTLGPAWLQPGKPVRIKANGDFKGLTGTVVDVWDTDTVQVRGDDGVLIGATFGERHLEAVE